MVSNSPYLQVSLLAYFSHGAQLKPRLHMPLAATANYTCKNPFNEGCHGTYIRTEAPPLMQVAPHLAGFALLLSRTAAANGKVFVLEAADHIA